MVLHVERMDESSHIQDESTHSKECGCNEHTDVQNPFSLWSCCLINYPLSKDWMVFF